MSARAAIIAGFAVILAVVATVDGYARRPGSPVRPLSATITAALRTRGMRVLVFGVWLWMGWHFLAR